MDFKAQLWPIFLIIFSACPFPSTSEFTTATVRLGTDPSVGYQVFASGLGPLPQNILGMLVVADPLDACTDLSSKFVSVSQPVFMIAGGNCSLGRKLAMAEAAGGAAALFDTKDFEQLSSLHQGIQEASSSAVVAVFLSPGVYSYFGRVFGAEQKRIEGHGRGLLRDTSMLPSLPIIIDTQGNRPPQLWEVWGALAMAAVFVLVWLFLQLMVCMTERQCCGFVPCLRRRPIPKLSAMEQRLPVSMYAALRPCRQDTCVVCLDPFQPCDNIRVLPCSHVFHKCCIDEWIKLRHSCPLCKIDTRYGAMPRLLSACPPDGSPLLGL